MFNRHRCLVGLAAAMASLVLVLPAQAAGKPGPAAPPAPAAAARASTLKASLTGNALAPAARGTVLVRTGPTTALSGDIVNVGNLAGTWLDLLIDGNVIASGPVFSTAFVGIGGSALFRSEPFQTALAPTLPLAQAHISSAVVVRVTSTTHPLGSIGTIPLSAHAGEIVAHGTLK